MLAQHRQAMWFEGNFVSVEDADRLGEAIVAQLGTSSAGSDRAQVGVVELAREQVEAARRG